jgi:hypothetical protein
MDPYSRLIVGQQDKLLLTHGASLAGAAGGKITQAITVFDLSMARRAL